MTIDIRKSPPIDIPQRRWKFTRLSLFSLGLVACAVLFGAYWIIYGSGAGSVVENTVFGFFVLSGIMFVYFTEKLMGFRQPTPKQRDEVVEYARDYALVGEYCRQVSAQHRELVVLEYDAIVDYVTKAGKPTPAPVEYGPQPCPEDEIDGR